MEKAWSIRAYKDSDEDQIFELVKAVGGEDIPGKEQWMKGWKWLFVDNPATMRVRG